MSSEEFWALAPRQLAALTRARRAEIMREEFSAGVICATFCNLYGVKKSPFDFMPSAQHRKPKQTWQDHLALIKTMHARIEATHGAQGS